MIEAQECAAAITDFVTEGAYWTVGAWVIGLLSWPVALWGASKC